MARLTIRNLDDEVLEQLRVRAAKHGRSMEEEARRILYEVIATAPPDNSGAALVKAIRALVEPLGGVDLELPLRKPMREPPDFSGPEYDP